MVVDFKEKGEAIAINNIKNIKVLEIKTNLLSLNLGLESLKKINSLLINIFNTINIGITNKSTQGLSSTPNSFTKSLNEFKVIAIIAHP